MILTNPMKKYINILSGYFSPSFSVLWLMPEQKSIVFIPPCGRSRVMASSFQECVLHMLSVLCSWAGRYHTWKTQKDRSSSPSLLWQTRYTCAHTHMYTHVQTYTQMHIKVNKSVLPASRDYIGLTFRKVGSWEKERKIQQHAHTCTHINIPIDCITYKLFSSPTLKPCIQPDSHMFASTFSDLDEISHNITYWKYFSSNAEFFKPLMISPHIYEWKKNTSLLMCFSS